jgi:hypothetical protein
MTDLVLRTHMAKRPDTRGFDDAHIAYLTHHAQEMHGPDDFINEVQQHLDRLGAVEPTGEDQQGAEQMQSKEAIQNVAEGGNPPVIPAEGSRTISKNPPSLMTDTDVPPVAGAGKKAGGSVQVAGGNLASQMPKKAKKPLSEQKKPSFEDL